MSRRPDCIDCMPQGRESARSAEDDEKSAHVALVALADYTIATLLLLCGRFRCGKH